MNRDPDLPDPSITSFRGRDDVELELVRRQAFDTAGAVVCLIVAVMLLPIGGYLLVTGRFAGAIVFALVGALVLTARLLTLQPEDDE